MTSNIDPADLNAMIPADVNTALSLPKELINRGLVLATKLALNPNIQNYQTPLKQCQGSYTMACVSFSKNGKFALISGYGRQGSNPSLIVWNVIDGSRIVAMLLEEDEEIVYSTALSKNAETALVGYANGKVLCWDLKNQHPAKYFTHDSKDLDQHNCLIMPIRFSPEQSFTAQASAKFKKRTTDQPDHSVTSIVFSPDERYYAECTGHLSIRIREIQSGKEIQRFPTGYLDFYHQMAFSNDGSKLIIAKGEHPTNSHGWVQTLMTLFDLTGKQEPLMFVANRPIDVRAVVFFPNDQKVLSLESGGVIAVWNVLDGNEILHWSHVKSPEDANDLISREEVSTRNLIFETRQTVVWGMSDIAVSPDGKRILSGGGDTFMRLWSLDGHQIYEYPHKTRVVSVAFTPDGQQALSGCWDGSAYLWELPR
jgi:WD40 repeat protein